MEGMVERWVEVRNHPEYEVSNLGQVRRAKDGRLLKQSPNVRNGAMRVALGREKYYVHRLVANSFYDGDTNCLVRHLDGDVRNNALPNLVKIPHKL